MIDIELLIPESGRVYPFSIPTDKVRIGQAIYVQVHADRSANYALFPKKGHKPYYVTSIQKIQGHFVEGHIPMLTVHASAPKTLYSGEGDTIQNALGSLVSRKEIDLALQNIANQTSVERMGLTVTLRSSPASVLSTVAQRIDLCRKLSSDDSADLIGAHQRSLVIYLLLTCFDRLGQPAPFLSFESWLQSKKGKHKRARDEAIADVSADPVAQAQALNQAYVSEYGVRNSFFRFLDEILPRQQYEDLLSSILSIRTSWQTDKPTAMDDGEKRQYLYHLRNSYTHRAETQPGLTTAMPVEVPETPSSQTFYFYEQLITAEGFEWVSFRGWPKVLEDCVLHGLAEHIRRHAVNHIEDK